MMPLMPQLLPKGQLREQKRTASRQRATRKDESQLRLLRSCYASRKTKPYNSSSPHICDAICLYISAIFRYHSSVFRIAMLHRILFRTPVRSGTFEILGPNADYCLHCTCTPATLACWKEYTHAKVVEKSRSCTKSDVNGAHAGAAPVCLDNSREYHCTSKVLAAYNPCLLFYTVSMY